MADDIWVYDFETKKTENITADPALDIIPMWSGRTIYFLSDRDENRRMNLYSHDLETKETMKLTSFHDYDIKFPSWDRRPLSSRTAALSTASTWPRLKRPRCR